MARSPPIAILHGQGLRQDDRWTPINRTGECRNHAHAHRSRLPVTTTAYRTTGPLITKPWPRARAASSLRTDRRHNSAKGPVSLVAFTKHIVRTRPCYDRAVPVEDEGRGARASDSSGLKMLISKPRTTRLRLSSLYPQCGQASTRSHGAANRSISYSCGHGALRIQPLGNATVVVAIP